MLEVASSVTSLKVKHSSGGGTFNFCPFSRVNRRSEGWGCNEGCEKCVFHERNAAGVFCLLSNGNNGELQAFFQNGKKSQKSLRSVLLAVEKSRQERVNFPFRVWLVDGISA